MRQAHKWWQEEGSDSEKEEPSDDDIKTDLTEELKNFTRKLCWFLGSLSFNLISVKDEEPVKDETKEQKIVRILLDSKVLSGGIENRYVSSFSSEVKQKIKPLLQIEQDAELLGFLENPTETEEDKLLNNVMSAGSCPDADLLLETLQYCLTKHVPLCAYANMGGDEALKLHR